MAVTQPQRWIIDWLLHNSMLHCKNSRPDIFQAFPLFIQNEVKVSINLERTIWHTMGNQSWTHASRWVQTHADCRSFSGNLSSLRPLHPFNDSIVPSFCCSERFAPRLQWACETWAAITQIFCLFLYLMLFPPHAPASERGGPAATCFISLHIL